MKRVIEAELETNATKFEIALGRFMRKFPELIYWKETFEYMHDNKLPIFCDDLLADGSKNAEWRYALHLDEDGDKFYMCVIERA